MIVTPQFEEGAIQSARAGDSAGFEFLYNKYKRSVYRRCLKLTRDEIAAEDLSQEVFVRVWQKISTFRGASTFKTWLYRVATNVTYMYLRKKRQRSELQLVQPSGDEGMSIEETIASPGNLEQHFLLGDMIGTLRPSYQTALLLHDLQGYRHREIAETTHAPSGTIKSNLWRARRELRSLWLGETSQKRECSSKDLAHAA
jgi:RNA polymerase sigma-70 factor, ECF subfamily